MTPLDKAELLERWLRLADSGHFRDSTELSLAAHPVADDTRAVLNALPKENEDIVERVDRHLECIIEVCEGEDSPKIAMVKVWKIALQARAAIQAISGDKA